MNSVFLSAHHRVSMKHGAKISFKHPLSRRMTTLQKCCLEAVSQVSPTIIETLFKNNTNPIFFSTLFGELNPMFDLMQDHYKKERLVSPLAFQHSVHNAAPGYIGLVNKLHNPSVTISSCFLSLDKSIYFAFEKLRHGLCDAVLIVHSNEVSNPKETEDAETELLVLCSENVSDKTTPLFELVDAKYSSSSTALEAREDYKCITCQEKQPWSSPSLEIENWRSNICRSAIANNDETVLTKWRAL